MSIYYMDDLLKGTIEATQFHLIDFISLFYQQCEGNMCFFSFPSALR